MFACQCIEYRIVLGSGKTEAQEIIVKAYDRRRSTIIGWEDEIRRRLGNFVYEGELARACNCGHNMLAAKKDKDQSSVENFDSIFGEDALVSAGKQFNAKSPSLD